MYTMNILIYLSFAIGIFTILCIFFAPIALIVGVIEVAITRKPAYHAPDRRVYFAKNHSLGYRFMARVLLFGCFIIFIPMITVTAMDVIYHAREFDIVVGLILSLIFGIVGYILSFRIKLASNVDRICVDKTGMQVVYRRKSLKPSFYPIDSYRGYDPQRCDLLFVDRSGSSFYINTKYLGKKYSIALGNDLIAMITGKRMNEVPVVNVANYTLIEEIIREEELQAKVNKPTSYSKLEVKKDVPGNKPLKDEGSSILKDFGTCSILNDYGPLKNDDNLGLLNDTKPYEPEPTLGLISGTEEDITEAAKGTLNEHQSETEEPAPEKAPAKPAYTGDLPDLTSSYNRMFIKNSYLSDIDKKTVSFNSSRDEDQKLTVSASHFPGSSWMYVDIKSSSDADALEFFLSCMNYMTDLSGLSKDIFFYSEDKLAAYIDGDKIKCVRAGKNCIFDTDKLELIPCGEEDSSDLKTFIKRKFYLDV